MNLFIQQLRFLSLTWVFNLKSYHKSYQAVTNGEISCKQTKENEMKIKQQVAPTE